jgi:hypothetical protein
MWQLNWSDPEFCVRYQKIFYFVLSSRRNRKSWEGEIKFGARCTSHLTSISTSHIQAHPRCLASSSPVAEVGRCVCAIPRAGSVASLPPWIAWSRRATGRGAGSDMVGGCEQGCVEELCWLFFVPCEQSAPMCVLLIRTPEQWRHIGYRRKALDKTRQPIASN